MSEVTIQDLTGVAETLLIPLYIRAIESQRSDALLKDVKAEALVAQRDSDFSRIKQIKMDKDDQVALILRNREFDRYTQDFMGAHLMATINKKIENAIDTKNLSTKQYHFLILESHERVVLILPMDPDLH